MPLSSRVNRKNARGKRRRDFELASGKKKETLRAVVSEAEKMQLAAKKEECRV